MKYVFLILAFLFVFGIPQTAFGCSCAFQSPDVAYGKAKAIFTGTLLDGTEKFFVGGDKRNQTELTAGSVRFIIDESFKGNLPKEVVVEIATGRGTSCGDYGLQRGVRYLIYAYGDSGDDSLSTGICTRTVKVDNKAAEEDLKFLRNLPPPGSGGTIKGSIDSDSRESGSKPIANAKVRVFDADGKETEVKTGPDGDFVIRNIPAGKYRIQPEVPQNYYLEEPFAEVEVVDLGTVTADFEAYFSGFITGKVFDRNGTPFNNAFFHLVPVRSRSNSPSTTYGHGTGANGDFSVDGIPPGEYFLLLELNHSDYRKKRNYYYPGTFDKKSAKVFKIGLNNTIKDVRFPLPYGFLVRTIEGQVFWDSGEPAANVEVVFACPSSSKPNGFVIEFGAVRVETDKQGLFRFEGFTSTKYWIEARATKNNAGFHSPGQRVVLDQSIKDIKLTISEDGPRNTCSDER